MTDSAAGGEAPNEETPGRAARRQEARVRADGGGSERRDGAPASHPEENRSVSRDQR